jgi:hypothetical protein
MMDYPDEPGLQDALYDELRRRLVRNQNRDLWDRYEDIRHGIHETLAMTGEHVGAILESAAALWTAAALTLFLAGAVVFVAVNADTDRPVPGQANSPTTITPPFTDR